MARKIPIMVGARPSRVPHQGAPLVGKGRRILVELGAGGAPGTHPEVGLHGDRGSG